MPIDKDYHLSFINNSSKVVGPLCSASIHFLAPRNTLRAVARVPGTVRGSRRPDARSTRAFSPGARRKQRCSGRSAGGCFQGTLTWLSWSWSALWRRWKFLSRRTSVDGNTPDRTHRGYRNPPGEHGCSLPCPRAAVNPTLRVPPGFFARVRVTRRSNTNELAIVDPEPGRPIR